MLRRKRRRRLAVVARTYDTAQDRFDIREAYDRGRRDERASRKRHPIFMTLMLLSAAVGLVFMVLAAVNGSFGAAGRLVDENLTVAAARADPVIRDAAGDAGRAVRDAATPDRTNANRPG